MASLPDLTGVRVLLLEDEMLVSLLVEDMLVDAQCILVGPFSTVSGAVGPASVESIDVAILDINVGGVKSFPIADTLEARGIPFVFLSGYGQSAVPSDRPNWRVCEKPFRNDQLMRIIAQQLGRSRSWD